MSIGGRSAPAVAGAPAGPTELGKLLCATRMRLGKDLQRIADILHIRYNYLVAIEDGRYEDLPGQAYAIGFVRAYADHLGLDGDEIVRRYKEESAGVKHKAAFEFQMPTSDSALPSGTLLLIAIVAGMLVYGVWYAMAGSDRSAVELIQEVPDRLAAIADPKEIEAALPVTARAPVGAVGADVPVVDGPDMTREPSAPPVAASPPASETMVAALPPSTVTPPVATPPSATPPQRTDVLELRAKADVWITLRDEKAVERTQFLRKDEVLRLPEQGITTLVTANAGDLEILVNGKTMPPLDAGLFARGVALDPQKLKTASAAPLSSAPAAKPEVSAETGTPAAAPALVAPTSAAPSTAPATETTKPALEGAKPAAVPTPAAPAPSTPPSH